MPSRSDPALVADVMAAFVREHDRDMRAEPDLTRMTALCDAHHQKMQALADHMRGMAGMMEM